MVKKLKVPRVKKEFIELDKDNDHKILTSTIKRIKKIQ